MLSTGLLKIAAVIALVAFLWCSLEPGTAWGSQDQEEPLLKARRLIREGDYEGAIKLLEDYIAKIRVIAEQKKNVAEAYYIMAKTYYIVGEEENCEASLRRVYETYPAFTIEEPDLGFRARAEKAKEMALTRQKEKIEEPAAKKEKEPEIGKPAALGKVGEVKKKKFPWLIAGGAVLVVGIVAVLLLKKKSSQPQFGDIFISSDPSGAKVYLDGTDTGKRTDCTLENVSAGVHELKIELEGYGKWEGNVTVIANQAVDVHATLAGYRYEFVAQWGNLGSGDGQLYTPDSVAVDNSGNLFVAEYHNHRIQKFTTDGAFITKWGSQGSGNGQFSFPSGVAVDKSGYVFVTEQAGNRIQKFTPDGTFITKWGTYGTEDGQFRVPGYIAADSSGMLYVSDYHNNRIQKFTSDGTYITQWGGFGAGDGQLYGPMGIAVDSAGFVYVSDGNNNRIQKFTSNGAFVAKWGSEGTGEGQFKSPDGIAVDNAGFVYVSDEVNHRIQKFTPDGQFMTKWGSEGTGEGQFRYPDGIAVDNAGFVYVSDKGNHRIQKFRITTEVGLAVTITYSPLRSHPLGGRLTPKQKPRDGRSLKEVMPTRRVPNQKDRQGPTLNEKK